MAKSVKFSVEGHASSKPLGRYLIELFTYFETELFDAIHSAAEFRSITQADHNVLRCLGMEGRSINDIAKMTGTTKQAVSKAVTSLEARGFVQKRIDTVDGRVQIVTFTAKGVRLFKEGMSTVGEIEKRYERLLGREELQRVKDQLAVLIENYEQKVRPK